MGGSGVISSLRDVAPRTRVNGGRYRWALAVVAVSAFMITVDNTVVGVALPKIVADLHMTAGAMQWVGTGYILMFSCLMIAGGRLVDMYGSRIVLACGMSVFVGASAVAGLAQDDAVLIMARMVQGVGSAAALPATLVIVTVGRTDKQKSIGMIVWVTAAAIAGSLGPTLGGVIVSRWDWGWIFLINIVPGIVVILLALVVLGDPIERTETRLDLPGVLISATMLFALLYGLEIGGKVGWGDVSVISVFVLTGIALLSFVVVESWAPDPIINLGFFRNKVFSGGIGTQMAWGIGFNGMVYFAPTVLQSYLQFSPVKAGMVMLPPAIAMMVTTPLSIWLANKIGPRVTIGSGMALTALGLGMFATIDSSTSYASLMPGVLLVGVGGGLCMPISMYTLKAVREEQAGVAGGILNVVREASGAFGIAIFGLLIHGIPAAGAAPKELETFRHSISTGLVLCAAAVAAGGVAACFTMPRKARTKPATADVRPGTAPAGSPREPAYAAANGSPARKPIPSTRATAELWPPPPPSGWYKPYDPEDDPEPRLDVDRGSLRPTYRTDAW